MSIQLLAQVWEIDCGPEYKLALLWIAESSGGNDRESIWQYDAEKLCAMTGLPSRFIPSILRTLMEDRLLVYDGDSSRRHGRPQYRVDLLPWLSTPRYITEEVDSDSSVESRRTGKQAVGNILRKRVFERDAYRCVHCTDWHDLTIDHIMPESKGGPSEMDNLQTLCRSCNSRKGVRV